MTALRNSVQLIGRLSRDINLLHLSDGKPRAQTVLGTREIQYQENGERRVELQYHQLVGLDRVADRMSCMLKRGSSIAVSGRLVHRTFGEADNPKYRTEVQVQEFMMI